MLRFSVGSAVFLKNNNASLTKHTEDRQQNYHLHFEPQLIVNSLILLDHHAAPLLCLASHG